MILRNTLYKKNRFFFHFKSECSLNRNNELVIMLDKLQMLEYIVLIKNQLNFIYILLFTIYVRFKISTIFDNYCPAVKLLTLKAFLAQ